MPPSPFLADEPVVIEPNMPGTGAAIASRGIIAVTAAAPGTVRAFAHLPVLPRMAGNVFGFDVVEGNVIGKIRAEECRCSFPLKPGAKPVAARHPEIDLFCSVRIATLAFQNPVRAGLAGQIRDFPSGGGDNSVLPFVRSCA